MGEAAFDFSPRVIARRLNQYNTTTPKGISKINRHSFPPFIGSQEVSLGPESPFESNAENDEIFYTNKSSLCVAATVDNGTKSNHNVMSCGTKNQSA